MEGEGEYYHVRFREPADFSQIRTPAWAAAVADEVASGSEVRMGKRTGGDDWVVQSVLVPADTGKSAARRAAQAIIEKIEG